MKGLNILRKKFVNKKTEKYIISSTIEEMAELTQVLSKSLRDSRKFTTKKLIEELAHASILLDVLKDKFSLSDKELEKEKIDYLQDNLDNNHGDVHPPYCLTEDTAVLTDKGYCKLKDILKPGTNVLATTSINPEKVSEINQIKKNDQLSSKLHLKKKIKSDYKEYFISFAITKKDSYGYANGVYKTKYKGSFIETMKDVSDKIWSDLPEDVLGIVILYIKEIVYKRNDN